MIWVYIGMAVSFLAGAVCAGIGIGAFLWYASKRSTDVAVADGVRRKHFTILELWRKRIDFT